MTIRIDFDLLHYASILIRYSFLSIFIIRLQDKTDIKSFILLKTLHFPVSHSNWFIQLFSIFKDGNQAFQSLKNQTKLHYSSDHKLLTQFPLISTFLPLTLFERNSTITSICQPLFDRVTLMSLTYRVKELANNANSDRVFITQH